MSPPAEKPRPSPVTITTRIESSSAILARASRSSSRMGPPKALSLSGRLSLMVAMEPAVLKIMASYIRSSTTRRVGNFHFLELLVLDLHRQVQHSFNRFARHLLELRSNCIFFQHGSPEVDVPLFVGLNLLPIKLRGRMISSSFAKFDELLVLFQSERLPSKLSGADALDRGFEAGQQLKHRSIPAGT